MKLDELEKMAQQTAAYGVHPSGEFIYSFYTEQLQAFARLIAEHERDACAKDCESINSIEDFYAERPELICAKVIRARGKP
jgi:hypothetical protein